MALEPKQRDRLVRFLAIAGQSSSDGEAINALRQAVKLAQGAGLSLPDALASAGTAMMDVARLARLESEAFARGEQAGIDKAKVSAVDLQLAYERGFAAGRNNGATTAPHAATSSNHTSSWQTFAHECLKRPDIMTKWEIDFCTNFITRGWNTPTPKQQLVFHRISSKCGVATP